MSEIMQKFSLQSQAAVVTGGGGLLGKEFCRTLAQAGAGVVVADLNGELAESTAEEIRRDGGQAVGVGVDVTRPDLTQAMVEACLKAYGKVDVLVCSAALDPKVDPGNTVRGGWWLWCQPSPRARIAIAQLLRLSSWVMNGRLP